LSFRRPLLFLLLLTAAGCAHTRSECERHGGTTWREITTEHFRLLTQLPSREAHQYALALEQTRAGLLTAWRGRLDSGGRLDTIVVRDVAALGEFYPENLVGRFARTNEAGTFAVMHGEAFEEYSQLGSVTLAHELAHHLSHRAAGRQPRWFAEGLATYLETVQPQPDGTVLIGRPPGARLRNVRERGALSMDALWKWEDGASQGYMERQYASAWLYVHFMLNRHAARFEAFQQGLARKEEPRSLWTRVFGDLEVEALRRAAEAYAKADEYPAFIEKMEGARPSFKERLLSDAEVHLARARIALSDGPRSLKRARTEVRMAATLDPSNVEARLLRAQLTEAPAERLALARALATDAPERFEGWLAVAEALTDVKGEGEQERLAALQRAVRLSPDHARAQGLLGWELVRRRQAEEAVAAFTASLMQEPGGTWALAGLAEAHIQQRQCDAGIEASRRAVESLTDEASAAQRQDLQGRVIDYEARCKNRHFLAGGVDDEAIEKVMTANRPQLTACWEAARAAKPELRGTLKVALVIKDDGAVHDVVAEESTLGRQMEKCTIERVRTWRFPPPPPGGTIRAWIPFSVGPTPR
jgi:tetratricopeptide (TPR) repeat protein